MRLVGEKNISKNSRLNTLFQNIGKMGLFKIDSEKSLINVV
jgi:hypothetical protein